ncbi:Sensor histidine kinase LiaS [Pontiella desulfatans]|uniref:Sensor histidine kinase LiaS n=1 Tax=Pontiella desulfatans TaxID=2750659 RepID=A0A6C2U1K8_PONDE|nr:histidine kinase [Pontiella desulfatans]VGO13860.1 Sensor histidine kinase LiaS [Pontiella desulfatans]
MDMLRTTAICAGIAAGVALTAGIVQATDRAGSEARLRYGVQKQSLTRLEQRLAAIDAEIGQLAHYSLRGGVGPVGYRSLNHKEKHPGNAEWIQIELGEETPIDQIVLVPSIWRDTKSGFRADGFPLGFQILAGTGADTNGTVIATYSEADRLLPRIAPLLVPCRTKASWIRVEAHELSPRAWDGQYNLQLAEILVFHGQENVALHQTVKTSSHGRGEGNSRKARFAVDGFLPYLMDAYQGEQSIAYVSKLGIGDHPILTVDLGQPFPLNRIHLHATDLSDTIPHSTPADFGIPNKLTVEGANLADFSDAVPLLEYQQNSVFDVGPIITWRFPEKVFRHVRLVVDEPYTGSEPLSRGSQIGFAEIELFSNGRNVARGKQFTANFEPSTRERRIAALTDGMNLYGKILPTRDWLEELARRHDLEAERPIIAEELSRRYAQQKINLHRMGWLAVLLAAGIVCVVVVDRMIRQRAIYRTRERIAADLHDELGANLHAIGLLGGIAESSVDERDDLIETVRRIRALTQRTGAATRLCTNMLEANGLCEDLVEEMKRASYRLLADLEHHISIEGGELLAQMKPRRRIDLFLFYKECLTNIIRHSGATQATTQLTVTEKRIKLTICDNGRGIDDINTNKIPPSLKRRARLLGAQVSAERLEPGGTCIHLNLKRRNWIPFPKNHS